jgi:hypothetical protein
MNFQVLNIWTSRTLSRNLHFWTAISTIQMTQKVGKSETWEFEGNFVSNHFLEYGLPFIFEQDLSPIS